MYGDWRLIRSWNSPSVIVTSSILASGALSSSALCGGEVGPPPFGTGCGAACDSSLFWQPATSVTATRIHPSFCMVTASTGSPREDAHQDPPCAGGARGGRRDGKSAIGEPAPAGGDRRVAQARVAGEGDRDPGRRDLERQHAGAPGDRLDAHQL